jgi:hypothetical protein
MNKHATIQDLLETVFSMLSDRKLYNENQGDKLVRKYKRLKLGGGQAYDRSND